MNIEQQFLKTIKKYNMVKEGDKVIVGVSGGPDSVCLLHLFNKFRRQLGILLYVAHLDHMFRGKESEEDARFVETLCHNWNIPFFSDKVDVPAYAKKSGLSPEDAARRVRYEFFREVKEQVDAQKIATGHNQNDHEETILMNILRGTGLDGLIGIEAVRESFIRPLIEVQRADIEKYLEQENIPFRIDATNLTTDYFRNSLRLELIPIIRKKYCPHFGQSLRRLSEITKRDLAFLKQETERAKANTVRYHSEKVIIDIGEFLKQHEAIKYRLVRAAVEKLSGDVKDFEIRHAELLVDFIEKSPTGSRIDLPKNLQGIKEYDTIILSKASHDEGPEYHYVLKVPGEISIKEIGINVKAYIKPKEEIKITADANIARLDFDKVDSSLIIRNRFPGDRFKPLGGKGFKKLKDFFIDEKVPRRKRNLVPIIEAKGNIVWVGGMRIDDRFKVTGETKTVLVIELKES
ncbi:MAG TPA: tRNA lysidine(34) synthetase TilS [Thermoanaerobacterales bacterium]|nr:tRNA lysidine(34) synthetase TilS [Thermoanaerobacterales bacterium]